MARAAIRPGPAQAEVPWVLPILLDPEREIAEAYQTYRFPESFLIDAHGTVLQRYVGPRAWGAPEYVDRIRRLVEAGGVAP